MNEVICNNRFAPTGAKRFIRKDLRQLSQVNSITGVRFLYPNAVGTAEIRSYSSGLDLTTMDRLVKSDPVTLTDGVTIVTHCAAQTSKCQLPAGTVILGLRRGTADAAGSLYYRLPGVEYIDL